MVVGGRHAGPQEDVVLDHRAAGDVDAGLDQDTLADACVEVDGRAPADHRAGSRPPRARAPAPDRPRSRYRRCCAPAYTTAPQQTVAPAPIRRATDLAGRARARAQPRALAEHGAVLDHASVADLGAGVDHRARPDARAGSDAHPVVDHRAGRDRHPVAEPGAGGDVSPRAQVVSLWRHRTGTSRRERSSECCRASSTRTTRRPLAPSEQRLLAGPGALDEVLALDAQRLDVGDPRREDVPAAGDVLAVAAGVLVKALVVDGQLALELHVVEGRHPP